LGSNLSTSDLVLPPNCLHKIKMKNQDKLLRFLAKKKGKGRK
jgi:hypothetical protein